MNNEGTGKAFLVLDDGTIFEGKSWAATGETFGEAVFSTGMTGYQETLTDPSYHKQIVIMTAPHIGNTGMNNFDMESDRIWVSLTRDEMVIKVRSQSSMAGAFLAKDVTTPKSYVVSVAPGVEKKFTVAALDLGIKNATPRSMSERGMEVHVLPMDASVADIEAISPDGLFISNGPGDPATMDAIVDVVRHFLLEGLPVFGICFGHQILGRALGFETYKLPFGHRGINQPVKNLRTNRIEITAHNHGFAVAAPTDSNFTTVFGAGYVSHICLNDGVVEGIELLERPAFSVQYHPESAAGPHDAVYLFDHFADLMTQAKVAHA